MLSFKKTCQAGYQIEGGIKLKERVSNMLKLKYQNSPKTEVTEVTGDFYALSKLIINSLKYIKLWVLWKLRNRANADGSNRNNHNPLDRC